jgi:23S rRNA pseudouridine1911/1915/1917 synthase
LTSSVLSDPDDADDLEIETGGESLTVVLGPDVAGERLDKALAAQLPQLSRARLQALMAAGAVALDDHAVYDASAKTRAGQTFTVRGPAPAPATPQPQAMALTVLFEDAHLIVIDKPAGMAAHPAPGSPDRTVVNALLHHCAGGMSGGLSGIGGVLRPGIVHRLDKNTSGVMVVAKSDAAHQGFSALFAAHDIERAYIALTRGAPDPSRGTISTQIARSASDRKKMAVVKQGGREAITHYRVERAFGPEITRSEVTRRGIKPFAARVLCRLETGRTHQIRVHLASKGSPCLGDPVYGSGPPALAVREAIARAGLTRQALHAAVLGFVHPITAERLRFESAPPPDMARLESELGAQDFFT